MWSVNVRRCVNHGNGDARSVGLHIQRCKWNPEYSPTMPLCFTRDFAVPNVPNTFAGRLPVPDVWVELSTPRSMSTAICARSFVSSKGPSRCDQPCPHPLLISASVHEIAVMSAPDVAPAAPKHAIVDKEGQA